jgi:hypothetical protein
MRVRTPHGIGSVIGFNQFSRECHVRLDEGRYDVQCDPSEITELPIPDRPPLDAPVGARARNVQSGVVGTVLAYGPSIKGALLVYIRVDGNVPMWCDPVLWEVVST